jgi:hypothetical protein
MMKKTKRANITIERERFLVISNRRPLEKWCDFCRAAVRMVDINQAAAIAAISQREIFRLVENGSLHFTENAEGALLICLESLRQNFFGANDKGAREQNMKEIL